MVCEKQVFQNSGSNDAHVTSARTLLARAADVPDFATLEAFIAETETKVRKSFERIVDVSG